jgi:hypothetical protein
VDGKVGGAGSERRVSDVYCRYKVYYIMRIAKHVQIPPPIPLLLSPLFPLENIGTSVRW